MIRALGRLLVMGLVMTAVLVAAVFAGVGPTTAIALGIVLAGIVGLVGIVRRPHAGAPAEQLAAMEATSSAAAATQRLEESTAVDAMAPPLSAKAADPEANMPRWRRPSLLEARRADPSRQASPYRIAMRFTDDRAQSPDVRVVRYAVVPLLDRPDEVLGLRVADLENGDEVPRSRRPRRLRRGGSSRRRARLGPPHHARHAARAIRAPSRHRDTGGG
jgi:hypothetical protein